MAEVMAENPKKRTAICNIIGFFYDLHFKYSVEMYTSKWTVTLQIVSVSCVSECVQTETSAQGSPLLL